VAPQAELAGEPFASRLRERSREVDIVHFDEAEAAAAIGLVAPPALAHIHCLARRDSRVWSPLRRQGRESIEALRAETRARRRARWLLVNSTAVGRALSAAAPRAEVVLAPLTLDPTLYAYPADLNAPTAGLIGTASWPPTANAVERLLRRVWPRVLERRPDAELVLAGKGMERAAFAHLPEHPGVWWRGSVRSATDFIRELGLLLYPLTAGSGTKVKVLEALALGLPVVTTPDGAEGICGRGGMVVEADDDALAAAASMLIGDPKERRAMGEAALRTFNEHHAPVPATAPVVELYERMLA
jgi:glycosyltransferase involved in cell wall biosynthesis